MSSSQVNTQAVYHDTGNKGQNTQWIHAEHIENTDNMCLQYAQWSNVEHI